jgi:hypothetical protein
MKNKSSNSIVISLGNVHLSRTAEHVVEMTIRVFNTLDTTGPGPHNHLADGTPGYLPASELEEIMENLRSNIQVCWHGEKVDRVIKEGES